MKKGFTLVELLAIIVILSIVALIVTPIISNVIESTKRKAAIESVRTYIKSANDALVAFSFDDSIKVDDEKYVYETGYDDTELAKIKIGGTKPTYTYLRYDVTNQNVLIGKFCLNGYSVDYLKGNISISKNNYCDGNVLEPGLYDEYDRLLASWDTLVNDYGMNINWYEEDGLITIMEGKIIGAELAYEKGMVFPDPDENGYYKDYCLLDSNDECTWYYWYEVGSLTYLEGSTREFYVDDSRDGWYALDENIEYYYYGIENIHHPAPEIIFQQNEELHAGKKLVLPSNITTIPRFAFDNVNVDTVVIPSSVTKIEKGAFWDEFATIKKFEFESPNSWRCTETSHRYSQGEPLPLESRVLTPAELNEQGTFAPTVLQTISAWGDECVKITD